MGVISLGFGTIIAQIINLAIQPILTRLVTPEDLGVYAFIISMANLIIPVASLKLNMLIVVEADNDSTDRLTHTSIMTVCIVSFLYLLFILGILIIGNNTFSEIGIISLVIPLIVFINGLRFVFISYNNRNKNYSIISITDVLREFSKGVMQVLSAFLGAGASGLALGYGLSPVVGLKSLSKAYYHNKRVKAKKMFSFGILLSIYKKNKKHIMYLVPAQFINSFSYTLITLSVIALYSTKEAGYYSISVMVLGLPLILVSNNVSKVYLQRVGEISHKKDALFNTYIKVIKILGLVSLIGFSLMALLAPKVTELVFGKGFGESGIYISILTIMYALRFIATTVSGSYVVVNKQNMDTIFQVILVISGLFTFIVSKYFNFSIYQYLLMISISYGVVYALVIINIGFIFGKYKKI